jgi:1-acyl-sn-glycerol-3-phosphate acyltransferase
MAAGTALRGAARLARVGLHIAAGMATVAWLYPRTDRPGRLELKRRWSARLLALLGVECRVKGGMATASALIVANHTSWVDIFAINALVPAAFVCKEEVRRWPAIGWLCARTDTIFMRRGSKRAARSTGVEVEQVLHDGRTVAVFPEGTTSPGGQVLPFHAALLQPAIATRRPVQPIALRYFDADNRPTTCAAYWGDMSFMRSLWQICCAPGLRIDVHVLPNISPGSPHRRLLAEEARRWIAAGLAAPAFHTSLNTAALVSRGLPVVTISA